MDKKQLAEICKSAIETLGIGSSAPDWSPNELQLFYEALEACDLVINDPIEEEEYDSFYEEEDEDEYQFFKETRDTVNDIQNQIISISNCINDNFKKVYDRIENLEAINYAQEVANKTTKKSSKKKSAKKKTTKKKTNKKRNNTQNKKKDNE
mgnify:CR=1 FL=1